MTVTQGSEQSLFDRGPGYAAMQKCLEVQSGAAPRGRVSRFFGASPLSPDSRSWYLGALGELAVGEQLARLGEAWRILHAVPVGTGDSDIDHVVIGPSGVFTINTKAHANKKVWVAGHKLLIDGFAQNYIRNSQHEATRASTLLSSVLGRPIQVTPLIVVVGASEIRQGRRPPAVDVLISRSIVRSLKRRRMVFSPEAVAEIADVAGRRATWHRDAEVLDDVPTVALHFDSLRRQVDAAALRRRLWALLAGVLIIAVSLLACIHLFHAAIARGI